MDLPAGGFGAGEPFVITVVRGDVIDGRWYALVRGFPSGNTWLRLGEDGTLYSYDADRRVESVWVAFATPEGGTFQTQITDCNKEARIDSRNAAWKGPIGEFDNALTVAYPPGVCADAGITNEVYLPYVGLVERTSTTIAGPLQYKLVYANLGGVTFISAPEQSFALALDKHVYTVGPEIPAMNVRLTLRNTRLDPFTLGFASAQRFDLVFKDAAGNILYRWSEGKAFATLSSEVSVGGELTHAIRVPLADRAGNPLPAGVYTAEGFLTNTPPKRYTATVAFEVRRPQ